MLARDPTHHGALADASFAGDKGAASVALLSFRDCRVQCCERVLALKQQCLGSLLQGSNRLDAEDTR
jgi:hypothetical protein